MASMNDLSSELLFVTFRHLSEPGRPLVSLRSLNLVCRKFHAVASELLFETININFPSDNGQTDHDTMRLLDFLHSSTRIRASIRIISISSDVTRGCLPSSRYFAYDSLERLLPSLTRLQLVRFVIIGDGKSYLPQQHLDPLFSVVARLNQVRISLKDLSSSRNPHPLESATRLESFGISPRNRRITSILERNKCLKHLIICLDHASHTPDLHKSRPQPSYVYPAEGDLPVVPLIKSLSLVGCIHDIDRAWLISPPVSTSLRSLSITGRELCFGLMGQLQDSLLSLKELKIDCCPLLDFPNASLHTSASQDAIETFLKPLALIRLSLVGFPSQSMSALSCSGPTLESFCYHSNETWVPTRSMLTVNQLSEHTLLAQDLDRLDSVCGSLRWLAFDIKPFHVTRSIDIHNRIPVPGPWPPALQDPGATTWTNPGNPFNTMPTIPFAIAGGRLQQLPLPSSQQSQSIHPSNSIPGRHTDSVDENSSDQEKSVLQALISFRSLRHLRLYVRSIRSPQTWNFSTMDAIYTFIYYRKNKLGCKLESVTIHGSAASDKSCEQSWTIFELGDQRVSVSNGRSQQIWDVSNLGQLRIVEKFEGRFAGYHHIYKWFKTDNEFRFPIEWSADLNLLS